MLMGTERFLGLGLYVAVGSREEEDPRSSKARGH